MAKSKQSTAGNGRAVHAEGAYFDGNRFHNLEPGDLKGPLDLLRWQFGRIFNPRQPWSNYTHYAPKPAPPARVEDRRLRVTFVGHATVLLQIDGLNILTDPVWSHRIGPFSRFGMSRVRPPGIRFEALPPIDVVMISHDHYDHLDYATLTRLAREHQPKFIVGLGIESWFKASGIAADIVELDWWQTMELPDGAKITSVPARHWSGRGLPSNRNRTLWCGYVFESHSAAPVYFAGDTGFGRHFEMIAARFPEIRLALLPIGAYLPRWIMRNHHMSPAEAVHAHQVLKARTSMAIHFGSFPLADDGERQPIIDLRAALHKHDLSAEQFWALDCGEAREILL